MAMNTLERAQTEKDKQEGIFKKSKKLTRTPQKEENQRPNKMDNLTEKIKEFMGDLREIVSSHSIRN